MCSPAELLTRELLAVLLIILLAFSLRIESGTESRPETGTETGTESGAELIWLTALRKLTLRSKLLTTLLPDTVTAFKATTVLLHTAYHCRIGLAPITPVILPPLLLLFISLLHFTLAVTLEIKHVGLHHELWVHHIPLPHHLELTL